MSHLSESLNRWLFFYDSFISWHKFILVTSYALLIRNFMYSVFMQNIMKLLSGNRTWLGLSYKEEENQWKWGDGSSPSLGL